MASSVWMGAELEMARSTQCSHLSRDGTTPAVLKLPLVHVLTVRCPSPWTHPKAIGDYSHSYLMWQMIGVATMVWISMLPGY
jgi:hypothetical protein